MHTCMYLCVLSHCECTPFTSCVGEGAHMYVYTCITGITEIVPYSILTKPNPESSPLPMLLYAFSAHAFSVLMLSECVHLVIYTCMYVCVCTLSLCVCPFHFMCG